MGKFELCILCFWKLRNWSFYQVFKIYHKMIKYCKCWKMNGINTQPRSPCIKKKVYHRYGSMLYTFTNLTKTTREANRRPPQAYNFIIFYEVIGLMHVHPCYSKILKSFTRRYCRDRLKKSFSCFILVKVRTITRISVRACTRVQFNVRRMASMEYKLYT